MTVDHMTLAELANLVNHDTENSDLDHPICGEFPHEIVINGWDYVGWE